MLDTYDADTGICIGIKDGDKRLAVMMTPQEARELAMRLALLAEKIDLAGGSPAGMQLAEGGRIERLRIVEHLRREESWRRRHGDYDAAEIYALEAETVASGDLR